MDEKKSRKNLKILIILILYILYSVMNFKITIFSINKNKIDNSKQNNISIGGRIFLCTTYNNEAEIAYIHIWRLYDYLNEFIIIISNITHSGFSKNVTFGSFEQNIKPFMNKINIVNFNNICNKKEYPSSNVVWCREVCQRDYAKTFIEENYSSTEQDFLIVVDLDEILTRNGIEYIKKNPPKDFYFLKGAVYFPYYYHRLNDWDYGLVVRYNKNMTTIAKYRARKKTNIFYKED